MKSTLLLLAVCLIGTGVPVGAQCPHRCRCDRLNTVDCSGLALAELPSTTGRWPPGTTKLLLQKNQIRTLPAGVFRSLGLTNLTIIDLSDNALDDIQPRAFAGLSNVVLLDLRRNKLKILHRHAFSGLTGGHGASAYGEQNRIDLRLNDIQIIRDNAFAWTKDLSLLLGQSQASLTIKPYAFYGMRNVRSISISGVKEVNILPRAFTNFEQLGLLDVSNSAVATIHNFTFEGLTGLGELCLHNCSIRRLETYAFAGIKYTKNVTNLVENPRTSSSYLTISSSTFPLLPQDAFRSTNLASVTLTDNHMDQIEAHAFRDMENLQFIHIRNNSLRSLSTDSFASVKNLKEIVLHGNQISRIEPFAFRDSGNIQKLSIGHSKNVELTLHSFAFSQLFGVGNFHIANLSKLIILPNAFKDVITVKKLKIENVALPTLERNSFNGLRLVDTFHISFCNVTTIRPGVFGAESMSRSAIDTFDMSQGNRIQCGCDIRRVLSEFQSTFTTYSSVQCVRVLEGGSLVPVPIHEVPVCAGCSVTVSFCMLLTLTLAWLFS